jgi:septation ring formation regulator EzrA
MAEPVDMIMPMLRDMRADILARLDQHSTRFDLVDRRLTKIEGHIESFRHALTADTLMSKLVTGEFKERIEALEAKVRELESHK